MRVPGPLIVPDSKPPVLLLSLGATLLAGIILRALRRHHRRARSSRDAVVNSTGQTVKQPASARARARTRALLPESTVRTASRVASSRATACEES
jgi:hypothetical protein